jgi:hypothetical protein
MLNWTDSKFLEHVGFVHNKAPTTAAVLQEKTKDTQCILYF